MADERQYLWPEDVRKLCQNAAQPHSVSSSVHLEDFIFRFVYDNGVFPSKASAISYYFNDGANSAKKVRQLIDRWVLNTDRTLKVLEFASGYGAVTRHARKALEPHVLHCSDIHEMANEFNQIEFGVKAIQSAVNPKELNVVGAYDVIFVLSFFSHMPIQTWSSWLRRLYDCLTVDGVLIFTTHGRLSLQYFPQAELGDLGFSFSAISEQKDLDTATYGQTVTSKEFVDSRVAEIKGAEHLLFEQGGWWGHQDLYVIRKTA